MIAPLVPARYRSAKLSLPRSGVSSGRRRGAMFSVVCGHSGPYTKSWVRCPGCGHLSRSHFYGSPW